MIELNRPISGFEVVTRELDEQIRRNDELTQINYFLTERIKTLEQIIKDLESRLNTNS
jgi:hypothetical protein